MLKARILLPGLAVLGCTVTFAAPHAHAANPATGTCVFGGSATFSPSESLVPSSGVLVQITGSGTCYGGGIPLGETVTFTPTFEGTLAAASCAIGEGNLFGSLSFSSGNPADYDGPATYAGGPSTATITIASEAFIATGTLDWSDTAATSSCPASGAASTTLTGTFSFVAT
jgi:hypothetical protein